MYGFWQNVADILEEGGALIVGLLVIVGLGVVVALGGF